MKKLIFDENSYLAPASPIEITLEQFEEVFVLDFPNSSTRPKLFDNYLRFLYRMQDEIFPFFEQWIDGSFVTLKENPNDIDLVTFIDYRIWDIKPEEKLDEFWSFSLEAQGIDSYLVKDFPEAHPLFSETQLIRNKKKKLFSSTRPDENHIRHPKGFLKIVFEKI